MTSSSTTTAVVHVPAAVLVAAASTLVDAGQWRQAADLLDATTATAPDHHVLLTLAAARAALENDYRNGTRLAPSKLEAVEAAVRAADSPEARWDLDLLRLRQAYFAQLFGDGSAPPRFGPLGRDPQQIAQLKAQAQRLHDESPDDGRRAWASMYLGYITDNIVGDRKSAPAYYLAALQCAEETGDDPLAKEALRHLGDHDHDDGDHELARQRWERSTELSARSGSVLGTLSQQLLLAVLARDAGDEAGAQALAREIVRWAGAIDATRLRTQAQAFLDGVDPTAPPPEVRQR